MSANASVVEAGDRYGLPVETDILGMDSTGEETPLALDSEALSLLRQTVLELCEELLDGIEPADDQANQTDVATELAALIERLASEGYTSPLFHFPLALAYVYLDMPAASVNSLIDEGIRELDTAIALHREYQTADSSDAEMEALQDMLDDREAIEALRQTENTTLAA